MSLCACVDWSYIELVFRHRQSTALVTDDRLLGVELAVLTSQTPASTALAMMSMYYT